MKLENMSGFDVVIVVIAIIAFYIFHAFCCQRISQRTNRGIPWMAWIPIAQLFQMCQIAGVRYTWILLLLGIFIPIVGGICGVIFFTLFGTRLRLS